MNAEKDSIIVNSYALTITVLLNVLAMKGTGLYSLIPVAVNELSVSRSVFRVKVYAKVGFVSVEKALREDFVKEMWMNVGKGYTTVSRSV